MADVEMFNSDLGTKKDQIERRLKKIKDTSLANITPDIVRKFEKYNIQFITYCSMDHLDASGKIEHRLKSLGLPVKVAHEIKGFACDIFLLEFAVGTPIKKIFSHRLDIASSLGVTHQMVSLIEIKIAEKIRENIKVQINADNSLSKIKKGLKAVNHLFK